MRWRGRVLRDKGVISVYSNNGAVWESQVRSDSW